MVMAEVGKSSAAAAVLQPAMEEAEKQNGCAGLERANAGGVKARAGLARPHGAGHR